MRTRSDVDGDPGLSLSERALFANDTFYLAFTQKDFDAMSRIWSSTHPTICIHPGWSAITSRDEILESWRRILGNPDQPGIDFYDPVAHAVANLVLVTCYEELPGGVCIATNAFVQEGGDMKLFHHQATPCANPPAPTGSASR